MKALQKRVITTLITGFLGEFYSMFPNFGIESFLFVRDTTSPEVTPSHTHTTHLYSNIQILYSKAILLIEIYIQYTII